MPKTVEQLEGELALHSELDKREEKYDKKYAKIIYEEITKGVLIAIGLGFVGAVLKLILK